MLTMAVDFDKTLAEGEPLRFRPGALAALSALKAAGHRLVLHSCRCNPHDPAVGEDAEAAAWAESGAVPARVLEQRARFEEMRTFLTVNGAWDLFDEVWQATGKPLADVFVDDKAEQPDWRTLLLELSGGTLGG